jgi:hypothetical protein
MKKHPLEPALASRDALAHWLWKIHNEVNAKLRSQNLVVAPDPTFSAVERFYGELLATGCTQTEFPGWDFLFSIADLHPMSKAAKKSVPMPGAPDCASIGTVAEKNLWNCLKPEERLPIYVEFWASVGEVLPFPEWRRSWREHAGTAAAQGAALATREGTMKWLYGLRCAMEADLSLLNGCRYSSLCKVLQTHRSGCSKSTRAKTCRKRKDK